MVFQPPHHTFFCVNGVFGRELGGAVGVAGGDGVEDGAVLLHDLRRALRVGDGRLAVAAGLAVQRDERVADDGVERTCHTRNGVA